MADTKFLLKKGLTWYLNLTIPKRVKSASLSGKKVRISLQTSDLKVAQRWRDRHVYELMNAENELYLLETLARKITEADRRLNDKLESLLPAYKLRGVNSEKTSLLLSTLKREFLKHLEDREGVKVSSTDAYRANLDCFIFAMGDVHAVEVSHKTLQGFCETAMRLPVSWSYDAAKGKSLEEVLSKAEGETEAGEKPKILSRNLIRRALEVLKAAYQWAIDDDRLPKNFVMPFKKSLDVYIKAEEHKHKVPPTREDADRLCSMPAIRSGVIGKVAWGYMPLIARYTGMRLAEIAQLHVEDIKTEHGVLCIDVCRDTKTKSSQRLVPVCDKLIPHIKELLAKKKGGRLFPDCGDVKRGDYVKPAHEFSKRWNWSAKKIRPDLCFHAWRVYVNSEMAKAGVDLLDRERILGHANERTNAAYLSSDLERLKAGIDKVF